MSLVDVIIDCDPGIDDALALIYAIKNPGINVKAITIVAGNVPVEKGVKNAQYVLKLLNRQDIPIYAGSTSSVYVDAEDTHGYNGLGNYDYGDVELVSLHHKTAAQYLSTVSHDTIIALGPLTNIWEAYTLNPKLLHSIARLFIMGGAFRSYGNCTPVSEYNFWCDPVSAKKLFEVLPQKLATVVPLDVTRKIILTNSIVSTIKQKKPDIGDFIEKITAFYMDFHNVHEGINGCVINDPLTIYMYLTREKFYESTYYRYAMVCDNMDITRGQFIVDEGNIYQRLSNCKIITRFEPDDIHHFWNSFINIICL